MNNVHGLCVVPISIMSEILSEWKERFANRSLYGEQISGEEYHNIDYGLWKWLSKETGLDPSRLSKIAQGSLERQVGVSFNTADRILCAIDAVHEWHHGRLKDYYGPIEVAKKEQHLLEQAA